MLNVFEDVGPVRGPGSRKGKRKQRQKIQREINEKAAYKPLVPRNEAQKDLMEALAEAPQVFAIGPAGVGKTYILARHAVRRLLDRKIASVVITRPTATKHKHKQGFLPGTIDEKMEPWLVPLMDGFKAECSAQTVTALRKSGAIRYIAFEHMRGLSISNSIVILDEAQNCDFGDLKLLLTRIGEGTQLLVNGDPEQIDIPDSGLTRIVDMVDVHDIDADVIQFTEDDCVRSEVVRQWLRAFSKIN